MEGRTGPRMALDLKPLLRREKAGEEPTSPATQALQPRRPEECKMFACAKLACTPALVRSPAGPWTVGPACMASSVHVVEGATSRQRLPTALSGQLSRHPLTLCPFFPFLLIPERLTLLLVSQGDGGQPRPSCQAPSRVGQALLAYRPGAAPSPTHAAKLAGWGSR